MTNQTKLLTKFYPNALNINKKQSYYQSTIYNFIEITITDKIINFVKFLISYLFINKCSTSSISTIKVIRRKKTNKQLKINFNSFLIKLFSKNNISKIVNVPSIQKLSFIVKSNRWEYI